MTQQDKVRELFYEQGLSITKIEAETGHTRKTISKIVNKSDWNEKEIIQNQSKTKIEKYKHDIDLWLTGDIKAHRKQRHTAKRVYERLKEKYGSNFNASYRTIANYVGEQKKKLFNKQKGFIPLQHIFGEAQVDFGKAEFVEAGEKHFGSYLVVSFPSSNAGFMQLFMGENTECLFEGLQNIFKHIGGVPTKLWFDNMSTVVISIQKEGKRVITDRFYNFKQHYGFAATYCNPSSGNEKGNVESKVGYHRRNLLVPIPEFKSLIEYNKELLKKCDSDHNRIHYSKDILISTLFLEDKKSLIFLPEKEYLSYKHERVLVDSYGKFTLNKGLHSYSTSPKYAGETILVKITAYEVIPLDEKIKAIVIHKRLYGDTKQEKMDWIPYLTQLSRKPRALKYSGLYELFPEKVKDIFNNDAITNHSEILKMLEEVTIKSNFETGIKVLETAANYNKYDTESLRAVYNRIANPFLELTPIKLPANTPILEERVVDFNLYDEVLLNELGELC